MELGAIRELLNRFADEVRTKSAASAGGSEDQLRSPFESLLTGWSESLGDGVVCVGEPGLGEAGGRPDYGVFRKELVVGYVELKAPGTGADAARYRGRNREQFRRFSRIPNLLYSDGNEWALYRNGERAGPVVRIGGDVVSDGRDALSPGDHEAVERLLRDFLSWEPALPTTRDGGIHLERFAAMLAPLCRMLREDVTRALQDSGSPLVRLAEDWRQLLFPEADDSQFADSYAQTVTFALLLARSEGADPLTLERAEAALSAQHTLLSRALKILTDDRARDELSASLDLLLRVLSAVPCGSLRNPGDPWLHFYEQFLAEYDPDLRRDVGVYYTPVEVVRAQVRLVDELLVSRLGKKRGFADPSVVTLDPALGTGTYLLGVIEHALRRVKDEEGAGAVATRASELAGNLYGIEMLVGAYAVSELRVSAALAQNGARLPEKGLQVFLSDTLESPHAVPQELPLFLEPISEQRKRALDLKERVSVLVCIGNPPYDRHPAASAENRSRTGGWVRYGDPNDASPPILKDFLRPLRAKGLGVHAKNLYNLYVYFWRWALWKSFEHSSSSGPGVVSFITASSYLDGDAFRGMRQHMREACESIWIIDLQGDNRGPLSTDNVFAIRTPVAIAIAFRSAAPDPERPAEVLYVRFDGTRQEKLAALDGVRRFGDLPWRECPNEWQAPFTPVRTGAYFSFPRLTDLMPWQHSGVQLKRTWPVAPDPETLARRWAALMEETDRATLFRECRDRKVSASYRAGFGADESRPIAELARDEPVPHIRRYAYRSFDRQHLIADGRLISFPRQALWKVEGERQIYFASILTGQLGSGPAMVAAATVPDLHHFAKGGGGKDILPLYLAGDGSEANLTDGLLDLLGEQYGRQVTPDDFASYLYAILANPRFTESFKEELESRELRVPITRERHLFDEACERGAFLIHLHTFGERLAEPARGRGAGKGGRERRRRVGGPRERTGSVPRGRARCVAGVPEDPERYPASFRHDPLTETLWVGEGSFAPVAPEVFELEISGRKPVQSWLAYRMKNGAGRRSSPLDRIVPERWSGEFTSELLEVLWVLEATVDEFPSLGRLLDNILAGGLLPAGEIPAPDVKSRRAPSRAGSPDSAPRSFSRGGAGPALEAGGEEARFGPLFAAGPLARGSALD